MIRELWSSKNSHEQKNLRKVLEEEYGDIWSAWNAEDGYIFGIEQVQVWFGKPLAVNLFFSRTRDIIAIEPLQTPRLATAFPVKRKNSVGWRINASPFCKHFNIRLESTERFIAPEIIDNNLLLKLSETVTVRQITRKKKG